ncbi:CrcB protein [Lysinibacillus parviboronicapiens]|uniref:Fluoride-specific ion channel FluC n=1 Tax=Lysinibacillus parviboronicapiens TaxID=436516 RepID=A0ABV2PF79_9BACI|nr:CrcB family protein [Lysinibacillus parviboronicapiens]
MILVGIGGFFGALTRFYLGKWIGSPYPWATFFINITGAFTLGLLFALHPSDWLWQLCGIGFLGAYTTFSTFGFEALQLIEKKKSLQAIGYICSTFLFGLLFATLGFLVA